MLSNCANPECNERFRYLGEGRIYLDNPGDALTFTREELYERCSWLCKKCSERYEVRFTGGQPKVVPLTFRKAATG